MSIYVPEPGDVVNADGWAVANRHGQLRAVSRRCRHQLADLSAGHVDDEGCLVCPWHQSRYDLDTGEMVTGPRGALGYHRPIPGYTQLIQWVGKALPLRVRAVESDGSTVHVAN